MLRPTLSLAEVPVRIISSNEEGPHTYIAGQRVELWCQLSRPAASVCWYKDGEEVEVGKSLVLEQEGSRCKLVLPCAQTQDTGEFVCDAGGDSAFYTITVTGEYDAGGLVGSRGLSLAVQDGTKCVLLSVLLSLAAMGYLSDMLLPGAPQQFGWLFSWGLCGTQTSCKREQLTLSVQNTRTHESTQHLHTRVFVSSLP